MRDELRARETCENRKRMQQRKEGSVTMAQWNNEMIQTKEYLAGQSDSDNNLPPPIPVKEERNSNKRKILVTLAERNDTIQHKQTKQYSAAFILIPILTHWAGRATVSG